MDIRGTTCRTCGEKFHACSNCNLEHEWQYLFCSFDCYKQSPQFPIDQEKEFILDFIEYEDDINVLRSIRSFIESL